MAVNSAAETQACASKYRPVKPVSQEIARLCHIYFDEKLCTKDTPQSLNRRLIIADQSALNLVTALANSGTCHPDSLAIPTLAPLPIHIEAVSILLVHPEYTTRARRNERAELAARCISFLRSILSNHGPLNANLAEAFALEPPRSRGRRRHGGEGSSSDDEEEETSKLKGIIMNQGRLRNCATDFWHIVGWALNCSVVYHKRWKYWQVWLDYMLDVLDADWQEREARDESDEGAEDFFKMRKNALLVKHLSGVKSRSSALNRVVGSIFVDGGSEDLRAYPEVFANETLEYKARKGQKRKRDDDFEQTFGEFNDAEVDFESESDTPAPSQETDDGSSASGPDPWLGGPQSIRIRQRVLALLSRVAFYLPNEFASIFDLYDGYCNNLKILPLPAFSLLMSPSSSSQIPTNVFVSLSQIFMVRILPNSAPRPHTVSKRSNDDLSQEILEKCFLPFAANTSSTNDNARVSILAESMLRVYLRKSRIYHTPDLGTAIEKGILARENKCKNDKRRRDYGARRKEEDSDRMWLAASARRLRSILTRVERHNYSDED